MIRCFCTILICIYCTLPSFSQEKKPLREIVSLLEKKYNLKFSYLDSVVDQKKVGFDLRKNQDIDSILNQLQGTTKLKFEKTGDQFVTIRTYSKNDKVKICGYILDENNFPIKGTRIFLKRTKRHYKTDKKGFFEQNDIPFDSPILISAPGYRQKIYYPIDLISTTCKQESLSPLVESLDEVIIDEYLTKGITLSDKVTHISIKELSILPGLTEPDILQSIQLTPGVNSPYETASGIYIRGGAPNQNLVLWNGIKTYHQGHFFGMISAFNPYVAKNVSFSKSGVDAKYGDRISGIIDIKTEDEVASQLTGGAGFNMMNADMVLHTPIIKDKVSFQISGRRSFTDLLQTPTYDQFADRVFQNTKIAENTPSTNKMNEFFYADYNSNLIFKASDKHKVTFNSIHSTNDLNFMAENDSQSFTDKLITENEGYNLDWTQQWNHRFTIKPSVYYTSYLLDYKFINSDLNENTKVTESKTNVVQDFGGMIDFSLLTKKNNRLTFGYHFSNNSIRYAFRTLAPNYELILDEDDRTLNTHSGYLQYRIDKTDRHYLSLGVRYNYYSDLQQSLFEPRLSIGKNITPSLEINATAEYRSQAISQIQESIVSDLSLENQIWTLSNDEFFPVITSYQITAGANYKKNKWYLDWDIYYKNINNITSLTSGFINPVDNNYHRGESTIFGADIFVKKKFQKYQTWISYSYINTQNIFDDINNNEAFPGNWNIEHTVKWSQFYALGNFQFSLGWLWHTGKAFTNVTSVINSNGNVEINYDEINGGNLPVYHRLDFATVYNLKFSNDPKIKYRIGLSVINLYNRTNLLNREFRNTNSLDSQFISSDIFSLGITPNLSFRMFW